MTNNIVRTPLSSNFTQIANDLLNSTMPAVAQKILLYFLSKPPEWEIRFSDVKHRLGLSKHAVNKAMRWLQDNGYAIFQRFKSGHTVWKIFDTPQPVKKTPSSPDLKPPVEKPQVENQPVLETKKKTEIINSTTPSVTKAPSEPQSVTPPTQEPVVVASSSEPAHKTPIPGLPQNHQPTAQKSLIGLSAQQITAVLSVFAHALTTQTLLNPIGYFIQLTKAAQNGTLTVPQDPHQETAAERIAKQKKRAKQAEQRGKMNYEQWIDRIKQQYGDNVRI